ncbi:MAG: Gfo/Idh/MocA family protein [Bacteroidales bacterium]
MNKLHTFGIIGAGMIAEEHIKNLDLFPNAKVKWLAAREEDKAQLEEVAQQYKIPLTTTSYTSILKDEGVDAVIICTPPFNHKEIFLDCLSARKHILIEKPASISRRELNLMINKATQYPELKICDASCRHSRLQPKFNFVKEIIQSGALGEVYYIHHNALYRQSRAGIEYHPAAKWFLDKEKAGGGLILDWGVYDLSFHLGILGDKHDFESLQNFTKTGLDNVNPGAEIYNVEEHFVSVMNFTNGLKYYWERSGHSNMEAADETRIYGTRAGLKFSYLSWESPEIEIFELDKNNKAISRKLEVPMNTHEGDGYELIRHFIDVLDGNESPAMPLELAGKHLKIAFENYNALEQKNIV